MSIPQQIGAFVIRFNSGTDPNDSWFEGRVEHVESAQVGHFYSQNELIVFIERALRRARTTEYRRAQVRLANSHPTLHLLRDDRKTKP